MSRPRKVTALTLLLGAVLVALGVAAGTSVHAISRGNDRVTEARAVLAAYAGLQRAVGGEAFAEAGYRRSPTRASRLRLELAISEVADAVTVVRARGTREDGALLSYLEVVNDRYAREVRATLDRPSGTGDDRVAGPALDAIQQLITGAVDGHRAQADKAQTEQSRRVQRLAVELPTVFLVAFGLLGWSWWAMLREHRRLRRLAALNEQLAQTDPLTGLANREGLRQAMDRALDAPDQTSALLLLDLDDFKQVNDTLGHHAGDLVLQEVASRVSALVRPDDLVSRLGGDEFAVFLAASADPDLVAHRILLTLREPVSVEGVPVPVGVSVGVARAPRDASDPTGLLRAADAALYRAKSAGRGRSATAPEARDARVTPVAAR